MNLLDIMNLLKLGGPVVLVLLVMSVVGLAVVFFKLIQPVGWGELANPNITLG